MVLKSLNQLVAVTMKAQERLPLTLQQVVMLGGQPTSAYSYPPGQGNWVPGAVMGVMLSHDVLCRNKGANALQAHVGLRPVIAVQCKSFCTAG
jgi:hypothetical protein